MRELEYQKRLAFKRGFLVPPYTGAGLDRFAGTTRCRVMARLQLARAYILSGNRDKARVAYQDVLTLWKNADPDNAVLKQVREEFARL